MRLKALLATVGSLCAVAGSAAVVFAQETVLQLTELQAAPGQLAKLCLVRTDDGPTPPPNCQDTPHYQDIVGVNGAFTARVICSSAIAYITNQSQKNEYRVFIRSQTRPTWTELDATINCKPSAEQIVRDSDPRLGRGTPDGRLDLRGQQELLAQLGYLEPRHADGLPGPNTREAVKKFQKRIGKAESGSLTPDQVEDLQKEARAAGSPAGFDPRMRLLGESADLIKRIVEIARNCDRRSLWSQDCQEISRLSQEARDSLERLRSELKSAPAQAAPAISASVPATSGATPPGRQAVASASQSCQILRPSGMVGDATTIAVIGGRALVFRSIDGLQPGNELLIGIPSQQIAQRLHQAATERSTDPQRARALNIMRAVGPAYRSLSGFDLQLDLVDSELYGQIMTPLLKGVTPEARQVSHADALKFIGEINRLCQGKATFRLPREEELAYVLLKLYYPSRMDGRIADSELQDCDMGRKLRDQSRASLLYGFSDLVGSHWHLTSSKCEPFSPQSPSPRCQGGWVVKGGTDTSTADECLPQYRGEVIEEVRQPKTTFRLVIEVPR